MKLLLTNDDGIAAPGLDALLAVARQLGDPIVVAPAEHESGCSHRVTTGSKFRVVVHNEVRYAVEGTPADCVRVALHRYLTEPTWVLSGINAGGNLGADIHHSGTVAAVREAVIHGCPGIALSYYHKGLWDWDWPRAGRWVAPIIRDLMNQPCSPNTFWNVNLPDLEAGSADPKVVYCPVDPHPLPLSFRLDGDYWHYDGNYHKRKRQPGSDVDVCFSGNIAVSKVSVL
ncbi:MAG: 5'/3'-nucleotidase SurE [Gemmataceae bacterium]